MRGKRLLYIVAILLSITALAIPPQDDKTQKQRPAAKAQPVLQVEDETIPDSLLHPRWKVQKTAPIEVADLDSSALDLRLPENIKQEVEYDDSLNVYKIGSKIGDSYLNTPLLMTPDEYRHWSERKEREAFFRKRNIQQTFIGAVAFALDIALLLEAVGNADFSSGAQAVGPDIGSRRKSLGRRQAVGIPHQDIQLDIPGELFRHVPEKGHFVGHGFLLTQIDSDPAVQPERRVGDVLQIDPLDVGEHPLRLEGGEELRVIRKALLVVPFHHHLRPGDGREGFQMPDLGVLFRLGLAHAAQHIQRD